MERYLKKLTLVVCMTVALAAMLGLQAKVAWSQSTGGLGCVIPGTSTQINYPYPNPTQTAEVLLVQDKLPYEYSAACTPLDTDLGAVENVLAMLGKTYSRITSATFRTLLSTDMLRYRILIIPGDQPATYYSNISANITQMQAAINQGLYAIIHLADGGPNSGGGVLGVIDGYQIAPTTTGGFNAGFISRFTGPGSTGLNNIQIASGASSHCIVTGTTNASYFGWNYSAHGYFNSSQLPAGTTPILVDPLSGNPTMIIYSIGSGAVLASTMTSEWAYGSALPAGSTPYQRLLTREISCVQSVTPPPPATLEAIEAKLDALTITIGDIVTKLNTVVSQTTGLSGVPGTLTAIKAQTDNIDDVQSCCTTVSGKVDAVKAQTDNIDDVKTQTDKIPDIQTKTTDIQTKVKDLPDAVQDIETKLDRKRIFSGGQYTPSPILPWRQ
ncbi:MAG: hypothetical protein AB1611_19365 [bacterium]